MKKHIYICLIFVSTLMFGQNDFTNQWQDLYSYNNVKDFTIVDDKVYAITENAMFIYDINTDETQKFSSVNGLSTTATSSVYFDEFSNNIIVGYENGLIELISSTNKVTPVTGVKDNLILVDKIIEGTYSNGQNSYVFGDFGIVELNVDKYEFGDNYKLGSSNKVNQVAKVKDVLYAATVNGLYSIDVSSSSALNPIDFSNWTQITAGSVSGVIEINDEVYFSKESQVYEVTNPTTSLINTASTILNINLNDSKTDIVVSTSRIIQSYDVSTYLLQNQIDLSGATSHNGITTNKGIIYKDALFVSSSNYGILSTQLSDKLIYNEIHPDGPSRNDAFFVTAKNNNIWISYGSYDGGYNFLYKSLGVSGFFNDKWYNIPYSDLNIRDITKIEINPINPNIVYVPSYLDGIVVLEYDDNLDNWKKITRWNPASTNNGIQESVVSFITDLDAVTSYLTIDNNDKLWVSNLFSKNYEFLSRYNPSNDDWETLVDFSSFFNLANNDVRITKMFVGADGNVFCGTKLQGLIVFKETYDQDLASNNLNNQIQVLNTISTKGALPNNNVRAVVVDENSKVWIGTSAGLVVFDDYENLYSESKKPAKTLIFDENGNARELLADTKINDIIIDLAGNKWFATDGAGVIQTSSDGKTTNKIFNISNSPLPTDNVIDLELDQVTGLIYMVTDKGVLVYDSKNEPYGDKITSVIAYPNPAIKNQAGHENITIVAKDGNGIPEGTNVKIMDVSGKLVYEVTVNQSNQFFGGKVVWDKTNLRGNSVVSGVYIVLLSSADGSETTTTKIAIIN